MPIAADFRVINGSAQKLEPGKPLTYNFELPSNVARGGDQTRCVLLVKYFLEGASGLTWELCLNGSRLFESSGSGSHLLLTMEAFDAHRLLPGDNQVEIRWKQGLGVVRIADTVVNYHINI
jgi:hypothetical protein